MRDISNLVVISSSFLCWSGVALKIASINGNGAVAPLSRLSYDNHPAITRLYRDWCDIEIVDARYTLRKSAKNAEEIFITRK